MQECLTNVHRHSGSKKATIRISREADGVSLEIEDQGTGMSPEKLARIQRESSGVGITGIRERVRHLAGVMKIESSERGTKVSVAIPVSTTSESGTMTQQPKAAG
jgi:two-component system NarL family sensor kinase